MKKTLAIRIMMILLMVMLLLPIESDRARVQVNETGIGTFACEQIDDGSRQMAAYSASESVSKGNDTWTVSITMAAVPRVQWGDVIALNGTIDVRMYTSLEFVVRSQDAGY